MAIEVIMPRVDMDMTTGRISYWFVEEGASVVSGQPLFEIETDKAAMEIEAPAAGILRVRAPTGVSLPIGSTVGWIAAVDEVFDLSSETGNLAGEAVPRADVAVPIVEALIEAAAPVGDGLIRATPAARSLARERGLDLASATGTGPRGRIQASDVLAQVDAKQKTSRISTSAGPLNAAWLRQGTGDPIVLIHGFGADLDGWRPFLGSAQLERPVLGLDLPGHGASPLGDMLTFNAFVDAAAKTLKAHGVTTPYLVGHSLGAAVATALAAGPLEARSLLLIASAGLGPKINGAFLQGFSGATDEATLAPWLRMLVADAASLPAGFIKATAKQRAEPGLAASHASVAQAIFAGGAQTFSTRAMIDRLTIPVRVVHGRDDDIISDRHTNDLPGTVALHLFAGVGHLPHVEARDDVMRILIEHVRAAG